jgi:hypothetical protein
MQVCAAYLLLLILDLEWRARFGYDGLAQRVRWVHQVADVMSVAAGRL